MMTVAISTTFALSTRLGQEGQVTLLVNSS